MKDARWFEVFQSLASAEGHFRNAERIVLEGGFDETFEGYKNKMAFMHAMQSAYTAFEGALTTILAMLGEERPTGDRWHEQLLVRCASELPGRRPAILSARLLAAAWEAKGFRNIAQHRYDSAFDPIRARKAADAGMLVAHEARAEIRTFQGVIDPPEAGDRTDGGNTS